MAKKRHDELDIKNLRWHCDPRSLDFETTESLCPIEETIGQERALKSLQMGVELFAPGYNIYVSGLTGTGKTTTVKKILENIQPKCPMAPDRCYVFNFKDPDSPLLITLPRGKGTEFLRDMLEMIHFLEKHIPLIFEDDVFIKKRDTIIQGYQKKEKELFSGFESRIRRKGFTLAQVQVGAFSRPDLFFLVEENPVPVEQLEALASAKKVQLGPEQLATIQEDYAVFRSELRKILSQGRHLAREMMKEIEKLESREAGHIVDGLIDDLKEKYKNEKLTCYFDDVKNDILKNLSLFKEKEEEGDTEKRLPILLTPGRRRAPDPYLKYRVNVVLDNSHREGCPVILETAPTYTNIFGIVERLTDKSGNIYTDFTHIKAGSLLKADGGYLVINAIDALTEPGVWKALKRTLKYKKLEIQGYEAYFPFAAQSMKPEPIDVNVKVILIGDGRLYQLLYNFDEDFKKVFKVKADFDVTTNLSKERVHAYASFVRKVCQEERLKDFDRGAAAAIVELAVRKAQRRGKISTRFGEIADIIREADFWSRQDNSKIVRKKHVLKAIEEDKRRKCLAEDKLQELIEQGTLFIDTDGSRVGQVNGLAVFDLGDYAFGRPTRITANTSVGKAGIINIEREAKMSGKTHDKGVLILSGYFREKFGQDKPISFSASICFEQSYGDVDGDSASSTEIFALISSLSSVPIKQGIAVTGSINQKGDIQPIGGVNQKIEGFLKVCQAKGLTGNQGVIIPAANVEDLMLDYEVMEAVRKGKFHIYSIRNVDEGIEILTGMRAGTVNKEGKYPKGTVYSLVAKRLEEIAKKLEGAGKRSAQKGGKKPQKSMRGKRKKRGAKK